MADNKIAIIDPKRAAAMDAANAERQRIREEAHAEGRASAAHAHGHWRGVALGGLAGMGMGILLTLGVVAINTQQQTAATVEAFGQGLATGTALPVADKDNYGDDYGHQKGGRSPEPKSKQR